MNGAGKRDVSVENRKAPAEKGNPQIGIESESVTIHSKERATENEHMLRPPFDRAIHGERRAARFSEFSQKLL
jgi:hypothetical protein